MHVVLSLTMMHDRSLSATPYSKLSTTEAFHWYQGTALFNNKISGTIHPSERDALWATTVLLGTIAFYHVDAQSLEEVWPLRPSSALDLNWLWMSDGKAEVWKLSQPLRPDSIWQDSARNYLSFLEAAPTLHVWKTLPSKFIELCELTGASTSNNNPYHAAASSLAQSLNLEDATSIIMNFIAFTMNMTLDFKRLLKRKDACALLILAYWYGKVCQNPHWWIYGRASMELPAICIYLDRYHGQESRNQELLIWPKTVCGIIVD